MPVIVMLQASLVCVVMLVTVAHVVMLFMLPRCHKDYVETYDHKHHYKHHMLVMLS
jgi:hypothetical protein